MNCQLINILLVEDDDIDAEAITRGFSKHHIINRVYRARDGIEALDALRGTNGHLVVPRPYLVLLDINMPRMNGIEFLEEIRRDNELKDSSVIVLTTSESNRDRDKAFKLDAAGYINKTDVGPSVLRTAGRHCDFRIAITLPE